jgi:hypothetical protein
LTIKRNPNKIFAMKDLLGWAKGAFYWTLDFFYQFLLDIYDKFHDVFLSIIMMIAVMILGFLVSWVIRKLIEKILILFRLDKWASGAGIVTFLERGGVKAQPSTIISRIVFWIFMITFFSVSLEFIGISQFAEYASRVTSALPYVVVSVIIVIVGMIFSTFVSRAIYTACENSRIGYGDVIAKGVRILLIIIIFAIVFEYMGLGSTVISISFLIIFGGIVMTLSLALGIGLSSVIGDFIKDRVSSKRSKK